VTDKIDFTRSLDSYRSRRGRFRLVEVPELQYLMVDGHGDPNASPVFARAVETLYPVAYALKFASKNDLGRDYVVPPLEGLWWAEDMEAFTTVRDKSRWDWTLMLMVPDWLDDAAVAAALERVRVKRPAARVDDIRLETLAEGLCAQTLHVGSFDEEAEVLARLHHDFLPREGLRLSGTHHEIYLSDFRKVGRVWQRTILRQPVAPATDTDL